MSNQIETRSNNVAPEIIEQVLLSGDLSKLNPSQKLSYYNNICEKLGLNPLTRPFEYVRFQHKEVLYARKDATDQLRKIHNISIQITNREVLGDVYVVTARASSKEREDESTGAITIKGLHGDMLANAYMKAETKAKRRVTLSICGMGILDETEVETLPETRGVAKAQRINESIAKPSSQPSLDVMPTYPEEIPAPELKDEPLPNFEPGDTLIPGKKYLGKKLKEVDQKELGDYLIWVQENAQKKGKEPGKEWKELFEAYDRYYGVPQKENV